MSKWRSLFRKRNETLSPGIGTQIPLETTGKNVSAKVECQILASGIGSAGRAVKRFPKLAPKEPSAKAFATWMAEVKCTGEYLQDELFETYMAVCQLAGFNAMPKQAFGFAMRDCGCPRWRLDMRTRGKGRRVWMIHIPEQLPSEVPRVPKAEKKAPPWPDMKPGPGISNGNSYAAIKKHGGFTSLVKAA
jgi:hypothetical protein